MRPDARRGHHRLYFRILTDTAGGTAWVSTENRTRPMARPSVVAIFTRHWPGLGALLLE